MGSGIASADSAGNVSSVPPALIEIRPAKLLLDKSLAVLLLLVTAPLALAIMIAIIIDSLWRPEDRGPVFYSEIRISQGRPFPLYKFRIFKTDAIAKIRAGAITKVIENVPANLTRVGRLLRKYGVDELPQFFSVLKGDMSFVGPRPKPVAEYELQVAVGQWHRTVIRAGLTGPAQLLKGTKRGTVDEIAADIDYIEKCRTLPWWRLVAFDLAVLRRTIVLLAGGPDE